MREQWPFIALDWLQPAPERTPSYIKLRSNYKKL